MAGRGWCPSTYRIYNAPDGGLARVKVPGGVLSVEQVATLAEAARRVGNHAIDITSRANLQLRGIDSAAAPELRACLAAVGLTAPTAEMEDRRNVMGSPTAGLTNSRGKPAEVIDVRAAVAVAVGALDQLTDVATLAQKFGVLIDGGGAPTLRHIALDLGLGAVHLANGQVAFCLALGESLDDARAHGSGGVGTDATPNAVSAIVTAAARLCATPPDHVPPGRMADVVGALGRDAVTEALARSTLIRPIEGARHPIRTPLPVATPLGFHAANGNDVGWVGLSPSRPRVSADDLDALGRATSAAGLGTVRLTPWKSVIVGELSTASAARMVASLLGAGWADHAPTGVGMDPPRIAEPTA